MPKCSTAPHQSFSLALLLLLYVVLPKLFLALAATKLPPQPAAGAPLSEQRQEASEETWLQTTTLGLHRSSLLHIPQARGQRALTVRQEVHPLSQALEVSMPQGCLRRNPAFGFVLHKPQRKAITYSLLVRDGIQWAQRPHTGCVHICAPMHM